MTQMLQGLSFPEIRRTAESKAAEVLVQHWPENQLPIDPVMIARRLGVEVFSAQLGNDVIGLLRGTPQGAEMFIDVDQPPTRWRFTVAHEVGHFVERVEDGEDLGSFVDRRSTSHSDVHEVFANHFAGALLMPRAIVQERLKTGRHEFDLASEFGVSLQAWEIRRGHLRGA
jgi:Zn-dependent peptidase ImmA (M78 family)